MQLMLRNKHYMYANSAQENNLILFKKYKHCYALRELHANINAI